MYDWNKDGKIDMVDHWITHQIINYEKEKRENDEGYYSPKPKYDHSGWENGPSLMKIILIDILLFMLICMMNSCGA